MTCNMGKLENILINLILNLNKCKNKNIKIKEINNNHCKTFVIQIMLLSFFKLSRETKKLLNIEKLQMLVD